MIPVEAMKTPQGAAWLGGAAATFLVVGLLAVDTGRRYLRESDTAAAWTAFHQGDDATARTLLAQLRDDLPTAGLPRLLMGSYDLDRSDTDPARLETAGRLFDEAWQVEPSASAAIGRCVVRLRQAAAKPRADRAALLAEADELLTRDVGTDPDAAALRAGLELLRGRPEEACRLLDGPPPAGVSRTGLAAWYHTRAMALALAHDGRALEAGLLSYQLRPFPDPEAQKAEKLEPGQAPPPPSPRLDPARLLVLTYRVSLADPAAANPPEALAARCTLAQRALAIRFGRGRSGGRGRFIPSEAADEAAAWNATGLGLARATRFAEAADAFAKATLLVPGEPLYFMNLGQARRLWADSLPPSAAGKERNDKLNAAASAFSGAEAALKGKKGREEAYLTAVQAAARARIDASNAGEAIRLVTTTKPYLPEAQWARDLAATYDHCRNRNEAIKYYKLAIEKGHKDAAELARRMRRLEAGGR